MLLKIVTLAEGVSAGLFLAVIDVINDVTCTRRSVITHVVIRFYAMTLSTE